MSDRPTPGPTRREGVPARPVRLSDGNEWGLLRPSVRLAPRIVTETDHLGRPVGRVSVGVEVGYPPDIRARVDAVRDACARGSPGEQSEAFFALAVSLLVRAHDVSPATACELLSVEGHEFPRLVRDVMSVVSEAVAASPDRTEGPTYA